MAARGGSQCQIWERGNKDQQGLVIKSKYRNLLNHAGPTLRDTLKIKPSGIMSRLVSLGVLTDSVSESIMHNATSHVQVDNLVEHLKTCAIWQFHGMWRACAQVGLTPLIKSIGLNEADYVLPTDEDELAPLVPGPPAQDSGPSRREVHRPTGTPIVPAPDHGIDLIDVWDGESEKVALTTQEFYDAHLDQNEVYPMYRPVRGYCLIINVTEATGYDKRKGSEHDERHLKHMFEQFHFKVESYDDGDGLTATDINSKVSAFFDKPGHSQANCAIMVLMSHGDKDHIYGTDGKGVNLESLYDKMNCNNLLQKPKIVLVQACAGNTPDKGKKGEFLDGDKIASRADFYIARASQPDKGAHRNCAGSWYPQAIVKVFSKYAATCDLIALTQKVTDVISRKLSFPDGNMQTPDPRVMLTKDLYFNPGIKRKAP